MIRQVYNADTYSLTGKIENIVGMSIEGLAHIFLQKESQKCDCEVTQ